MNTDDHMDEGSVGDLESVKARLSQDESQRTLREVDDAIQKISHMRSRLASSLSLQNGHLLTGSIRFAAFRVETISLIFDFARKNFASVSAEGLSVYSAYLEELGETVGVTYARELLQKLIAKGQIIHMVNNDDIIDLWAMFENETGAGVTERVPSQPGIIVIKLKNNPIRSMESQPHVHCVFYRAYIKALLNEFLTSRPRQLQRVYPRSRFDAQKISELHEKPDADDDCVFYATLTEEHLVPAFDLLERAWVNYENESYGDALNDARSALERAQLNKVGCNDDMAARELHSIFEKKMDKSLKKVWHEVYHRLSEGIHRKGTADIDVSRIRTMLMDVRRCIYALEFLHLPQEEISEIRERLDASRAFTQLLEAVRNSPKLDSSDIDQLTRDLEFLRKGKLDDSNQKRLVLNLKSLSGPVWDVAQRVLSSLISEAIKRQVGLGGN